MSSKRDQKIGNVLLAIAIAMMVFALWLGPSIAGLSNAGAFENTPLLTPPSLVPLAENDANVRAMIEDLQKRGYKVAVTHFASTDAVSVSVGGKSSNALRDVCMLAREHNVMLIGSKVTLKNGASATPWNNPYEACDPAPSYNWRGL